MRGLVVLGMAGCVELSAFAERVVPADPEVDPPLLPELPPLPELLPTGERCPEPDPALSPAYDDAPPAESPAEGLWGFQGDELQALANLGYVDGSELPSHPGGVTVHRRRARPGYAFYTSGEGPVAILMDLDGRELHRWQRPFRDIWPERIVDDRRSEHQYWRRAALRPNGDVLAIVEGQGLVRLDWYSEIVWSWGGGAHHDLEVLPDERVWVLSRRARVRPEHAARPILEDFVTRLDPWGCPEVRISLVDAVRASPAGAGFWVGEPHGDVFHTNSLRVLDEAMAEAHPAFEPGFLLLSMRTPSGVLVLDPDAGEVVWWWQGPFREQHDPEITEDGQLVLFDNIGLGPGRSAVRGFALDDGEEVLRIDTIDGEQLYSRYLGAVQRLDRGHLLITESTQGRAIEVDRRGRVVWEFHNPERAGPSDEFVAVLPEMLRIPEGYLDVPPR